MQRSSRACPLLSIPQLQRRQEEPSGERLEEVLKLSVTCSCNSQLHVRIQLPEVQQEASHVDPSGLP